MTTIETNDNDGELTLAQYREHIRTMADVIEEEREEYADDLHDMIWQQVDGSTYIQFYSYNLDVLRHSENEPHDWKHMVADDDGYRKVLQVMAYSAMEADLYDELNRRGVEW